MKKTVSMLALLGAFGAAQAAGIPANLNLDGLCDSMTGLHKKGTGAAGTWSNLDCAGASASLGGAQGKAKGAGAKGYIMGSTGFAPIGGRELTWSITADHTWTIYDVDGSVLNSGTWSTAAEGAARGTKSSTGQ